MQQDQHYQTHATGPAQLNQCNRTSATGPHLKGYSSFLGQSESHFFKLFVSVLMAQLYTTNHGFVLQTSHSVRQLWSLVPGSVSGRARKLRRVPMGNASQGHRDTELCPREVCSNKMKTQLLFALSLWVASMVRVLDTNCKTPTSEHSID